MAIEHSAGNKKHLPEIIVNLEICIQGEILLKLGIGLKLCICMDLASIYEPTRNYWAFSTPKNPLFTPFFPGAKKP